MNDEWSIIYCLTLVQDRITSAADLANTRCVCKTLSQNIVLQPEYNFLEKNVKKRKLKEKKRMRKSGNCPRSIQNRSIRKLSIRFMDVIKRIFPLSMKLFTLDTDIN